MTRKVAFLEKVFLDRRASGAELRGVELFNLRLVRDLCARGVSVTLFTEPSWRSTVLKEVPDAPSLRLVSANGFGSSLLAGFAAACRLRRMARREGAFDALLLGNVANRLIPALWLLRAGRDFRYAVLIAHREPSARFLRAISRLPGRILAVSEPVAADFRGRGLAAEVMVDYGIMDAHLFYPSSTSAVPPALFEGANSPSALSGGGASSSTSVVLPAPSGGGAGSNGREALCRFCVLGALDNAWKGADTAIAAFRLLPEAVRAHCELHLLGFRSSRDFPGEPSIIAYSWQSAAGVPDFLRSMDVMLVPSRDEHVMRETFSQSVVQGMLTGLPVVYAPLPVLAEKFDRGGGFRASTPQEFADAMARLAENPNLRAELGAQGRAVALSRYVWDTGRFVERHLLAHES